MVGRVSLAAQCRNWGAGAIVVATVLAVDACSPAGTRQSEPAASAPVVAPHSAPDSFKTAITFDEARAALDASRDSLPASLRGKPPNELEASWPGWVSRHNAAIRSRLDRGDEDSVVNLWQFGTSFTARPRISERSLARLGGPTDAEELLIDRLDDLVAALVAPGASDRLRFARQVLERHGIDVTTPAGQDAARVYLVNIRARGIAEHQRYRAALQGAMGRSGGDSATGLFATLYRERGLSSDTSIAVDFALDQAIAQARLDGHLAAGAVTRIAIVGPGLDFTDKAEGYDFYPQQTIQPFALIDSLLRHGAARAGAALQVVTFDLSPRVNQHLESARARAGAGQPYVLQLPLDRDWPGHQWRPDFLSYWRQLGSRIGDEVPPAAPPRDAPDVRVRAVQVRPAVVTAIVPRDLNIVLERVAAPAPEDRFDLIVATNILVYYDAFEQRLALANIAAMLEPGGFFLTNYQMSPLPPMEPSSSVSTTVTREHQQEGDSMYWYRRR